jgi:hypothetical protein
MANETTSTTITEIIRSEAIGAAALFYESTPGVADFVTMADISGQATNVYTFPILDRVSAAAIAEGTDYTTNSAIDTSGSAQATATEHIVKSTITDYSGGANNTANVNAASAEGSTVGTMFARAMQKRQDLDITALFASLNSSTGSNAGPLTATLVQDATSLLDENDIPPSQRAMVLHPTQFKALKGVFDDASTFGRQGQEILDRGAAGVLYGATVFSTTAVATATVSSSTVYAGACMHVDAVGVVEKDGNMFEVERDGSLRAAEVMLVKKWGEVEYRGGATTNGRGGAGVYLYSNTTN